MSYRQSFHLFSNPSEESNPDKPEEDLEDGEIEDDEEEAVSQEEPAPEPSAAEPALPDVQPALVEPSKSLPPNDVTNKPLEPIVTEKNEKHKDRSERDRRRHEEKSRRGEEKGHRHMTEAEKSILHLRKKEKLMREREKWEKARRKEAGIVEPMDDDFAKNIEKTLATILSKKEKEAAGVFSGEEEKDLDKRGKKRKHYEKERQKNKQRRANDSPRSEEIDENELLNIRGGSPEQPQPIRINDRRSRSPSRSEESYESEYSTDQSKNEERNKKKNTRKEKKKTRDNNRERNRREREKRNEQKMQMQDSQGVCVFYLQGKCQKNDCPYSHEANPPMKLELCKFYLMDCCAKGEKCSYMHSEFPCKFYHTGLQCTKGDDCKFAHGAPLSEGLKQILFKHIETAPRDILGGFPRMSREEALNQINETQQKLHFDHYGMSQQSDENKEGAAKGGIPSLFDISVPVPPELNQGIDDMKALDKKEKSNRKRASRWQDPDPSHGFPLKPFNYGQDQDMRINSNGDIDMRTLPTLSNLPISQPSTPTKRDTLPDTQQELSSFPQEHSSPLSQSQQQTLQDVDIRGTNLLSSFNTKDVDIRQQSMEARFLPSMDVDIRQIPGIGLSCAKESETEDEPMLEIDTGEEEMTSDPLPTTKDSVELPNTAAHLFARIQAQQKDEGGLIVNMSEERFDMDVTDINWYSDDDDDEDEHRLTIKVEDDDRGAKEKEETDEREDDADVLNIGNIMDSISPPPVKPIDVVSKLGDLSKIDISAEVTKLLTSMVQNRNKVISPASETKIDVAPGSTPPRGSRPPRQDPRTGLSAPVAHSQESSRILDPRLNLIDPRQRSRQSSTEVRTEEKKSGKMSIYEQGGIDMNLKNLKAAEELESDDFKSSLRPDIDLRHLTLPFKGMQNYTPASEIDASVNSHLPMPWRVVTVEIPRPDYTGLKLSINDAEKTGDPRLRKIFRLSIEEKDSPMSPKASPKATSATRVDPRLKKIEEKSDGQMNYIQQLNLLQSSVFYQSLTSNQKLMLNQELSMRTDQSGTNDPVLHSLLSSLNLVSGATLPGNQNVTSALSILANVNNMNPMLGQGGLNQPPGMVMQPGLLGAAPGIPNVVTPDFSMGFDPRNGGLLGNVPPPGFPPNFAPQVDSPFANFGGVGDDFYPQTDNFGHGNRGNRDFHGGGGGGGGNRDNRRRGKNYNNNRNNNRNNFRNNSNRNNNRANRNHSPP